MYYYGIIKTSQIFINLLVKDTKKKGTMGQKRINIPC